MERGAVQDLSTSSIPACPATPFHVFGAENTLALSGELDVAGWQDLEDALSGATDSGDDLVVDLSQLEFIDAGGAGRLLAAANRSSLELRSPRRLVLRVLEVLGATDHPGITLVPGPETSA